MNLSSSTTRSVRRDVFSTLTRSHPSAHRGTPRVDSRKPRPVRVRYVAPPPRWCPMRAASDSVHTHGYCCRCCRAAPLCAQALSPIRVPLLVALSNPHSCPGICAMAQPREEGPRRASQPRQGAGSRRDTSREQRRELVLSTKTWAVKL